MASTYEVALTLRDSKALTTTLRFTGIFIGADAPAEYALALAAAQQLQQSIEAVTDAIVAKNTLAYVVAGDTAVPAAGVADITDECAVVCFLTAAGVAPKYHTLRIPAPIDGMFESDGYTLDESNVPVQQFVANFDDADIEFSVSDNEKIVTANDNGISHGFWRSRSKSTRKLT